MFVHNSLATVDQIVDVNGFDPIPSAYIAIAAALFWLWFVRFIIRKFGLKGKGAAVLILMGYCGLVPALASIRFFSDLLTQANGYMTSNWNTTAGGKAATTSVGIVVIAGMVLAFYMSIVKESYKNKDKDGNYRNFWSIVFAVLLFISMGAVPLAATILGWIANSPIQTIWNGFMGFLKLLVTARITS